VGCVTLIPPACPCLCPGCGYDLREQRTEVVRCPECGRSWRGETLARDRTPWFQSPEFNQILSPAAWLAFWGALTPLLIGGARAVAGDLAPSTMTALWIGLVVVGAGVWINLLLGLQRHCVAAHAAWLALLVHAALGFYASALFLALLSGVLLWSGTLVGVESSIGVPGCVALAAALAWCGRRLERSIAKRCRLAAAENGFEAIS
jgi:hypothetical protein